MSLLIVGLPVEVTDQLIPLLVGQGDEVRIVESEATRIERWRSLGAHVARGAPDDDDLVERAAQNVRTLIVGDDATREALEGARRAGVGRFVHLGVTFRADEMAVLVDEFVILRHANRRRLRGKGKLGPLDAARLIDAADDLAGDVTLDLDATDASTWTRLSLDAPRGS
jgi:hypothetical protein